MLFYCVQNDSLMGLNLLLFVIETFLSLFFFIIDVNVRDGNVTRSGVIDHLFVYILLFVVGQMLLCQTNFFVVVYWLVLDVKEPCGYQGVTMQVLLGYVY